jgi:NAD+ synthase (glutamine-hydrolysing)
LNKKRIKILKIVLSQLNPTIGDFQGNLKKIQGVLEKTEQNKPELVVLPELFLSGYPPRDLLERKEFIQENAKCLKSLKRLSVEFPNTGILCGTILPTNNTGKVLFNSAVLIQNGDLLFQQHKSLLPTYDVFDEARYFKPALSIHTYKFKGLTLGITICEDVWNVPEIFQQSMYESNPVETLARQGASLIINLSASPFGIEKEIIRYNLARYHAVKHQLPFIFVNLVGSNDELIFDGNSMVVDHKGRLLAKLPAFQENIQIIDLNSMPKDIPFEPIPRIESVYHALILGIQDYMDKCGFEKAVLGLSGGIDSALVCCLAKEALGPKNVLAVALPSPYSSESSFEDAKTLAENLGIQFKTISITPIYESYITHLKDHFNNLPENETEENIQARIRGNILMALSNKFGYLTLSTGNKSELSVGYCTLYGDMSGGLGVLADVPKTLVYQLAKYVNRDHDTIPQNILTKSPSAELKPDQKDQDTLPPYEILDEILHYYLDEGLTREEIISKRIDKKIVDWVLNAVDRNEYKRRQAAPGLKITTKAFGMGRRMPIARKY